MQLKKLLTTTLLTVSCVTVLSAQDILWEKSYGGKHAEYLYEAIPTPDYGFILAGSSVSGKNGNKEELNKGDLDYWIWKMDEHGNLDWQKSFGGNQTDLLQSIALTNDGGFILGGTSASDKGSDKTEACKGQEDFWVVKLNAKGQELWQRTIGGSGMEKLLSIAPTRDGGYILGGSSSSDQLKSTTGVLDPFGKSENSKGNLDFWVVKLDKNGTIAWQKTIGGRYMDELRSIHEIQSGGYILGGYSNSPVSGNKTEENPGLGDYWVVQLDEQGEIAWQKVYGGEQDDNLTVLIPTQDGGYLLGGSSNSEPGHVKTKSNGSGTDFWVVKLDETGGIVWQQTYNYGKKDILTSLIENPDGSFLIGGYAQSEVEKSGSNPLVSPKDKEGINDYIALKIKADGEELWSKTVGSKGDEVLKKVLETRDGGYLLCGTSNGSVSRDKKTAKGGNDFWVVKLKDKDKEEQERISLEAVPNPTEYFTNVIVSFEYTKGTATLYDLSGRTIRSASINGEKTIPMELTNLPTGIYVIEIKTDTQTGGVKVIKK
ncbi:T9SS type A sorting domain-containing protein [Flavobacterium sp. U410]